MPNLRLRRLLAPLFAVLLLFAQAVAVAHACELPGSAAAAAMEQMSSHHAGDACHEGEFLDPACKPHCTADSQIHDVPAPQAVAPGSDPVLTLVMPEPALPRTGDAAARRVVHPPPLLIFGALRR